MINKAEELQHLKETYPQMSPFVILKLSMTRYGTVFSKNALQKLQDPYYSFGKNDPFQINFRGRSREFSMPGPILLRDGTNVYINYGEAYENPYLIDWCSESNQFYLCEGQTRIDTLDFVPRPAFFGKCTSKGTPMESLADVRAKKLILTAFQKCKFWSTGEQCKFCAFFTKNKSDGVVDCEDLFETVSEALKTPGCYEELYLSGGSDFSGEPAFQVEIDRYVNVLQKIGTLFSGRFSCQLMAPAYPKAQLQRIYNETGITSYCPDIEIWDKKLFKELCPGKDRWVGYENWIKHTLDAVEVFGKGKVQTQVVAGVELAAPNGFSSIDAALESNFEACEFYAKNGVLFLSTIWRPHSASRLGILPMPPLEYYIRLALGLHNIHRQYDLYNTNDDYKHCGNHPDSDLERGDFLC